MFLQLLMAAGNAASDVAKTLGISDALMALASDNEQDEETKQKNKERLDEAEASIQQQKEAYKNNPKNLIFFFQTAISELNDHKKNILGDKQEMPVEFEVTIDHLNASIVKYENLLQLEQEKEQQRMIAEAARQTALQLLEQEKKQQQQLEQQQQQEQEQQQQQQQQQQQIIETEKKELEEGQIPEVSIEVKAELHRIIYRWIFNNLRFQFVRTDSTLGFGNESNEIYLKNAYEKAKASPAGRTMEAFQYLKLYLDGVQGKPDIEIKNGLTDWLKNKKMDAITLTVDGLKNWLVIDEQQKQQLGFSK